MRPDRVVRPLVVSWMACVLVAGAAVATPGATHPVAVTEAFPGESLPPLPAPGSTWQDVPPEVAFVGRTAQPWSIEDVAAGGPGLVAVGSDGWGASIWTSPDGVSWSRAVDSTTFDGAWAQVVASDGTRLVALGGAGGHPTAWTSHDGRTWRATGLDSPMEVLDLAAAPGRFVAVGLADCGGRPWCGAAWTSADGRGWVPLTAFPGSIPGREVRVTSVARTETGFVAAGVAWAGADHAWDPLVWTSPDGLTWLPATLPAGTADLFPTAVAAGPRGIVVVGWAGHSMYARAGVLFSPDGVTWSRVPETVSLVGASMTSVTAAADGFVAVGIGAPLTSPRSIPAWWSSPDGITWTVAGGPPDPGAEELASIVPVAGRFVAIGRRSTMVPVSPTVSVGVTSPTVWVTPAADLPSVIAPPTPGAVRGEWLPVEPMRVAHAGPVATRAGDGRIYVIGGLGLSGGRLREIRTTEAYDPVTDAWTQRRPMPTTLSTLSAEVACRDGRIRVFGLGSRYLRYDPRTNAWVGPIRIPDMDGVTGAATGGDGRLYVFGWHAGRGEVHSLDHRTGEWRFVRTVPAAALGAATTAPDGRIYITTRSRLWVYDPSTRVLRNIGPLPQPRRGAALAVAGDGTVWLVGGETPGLEATTDVYDPVTGAWAPGPELATGRLSAAAATDRRGRIYVLGGIPTSAGGPLATVEVLSR